MPTNREFHLLPATYKYISQLYTISPQPCDVIYNILWPLVVSFGNNTTLNRLVYPGALLALYIANNFNIQLNPVKFQSYICIWLWIIIQPLFLYFMIRVECVSQQNQLQATAIVTGNAEKTQTQWKTDCIIIHTYTSPVANNCK